MSDIEIKILPERHLITPALETVREYAKSFFNDDKKLNKICLGLEEAIANVISYGYSKHLEYILICIEAANGAFTISIIDKGLPGNYEKTLKGEDRLGLEIMRNVVDEMTIINMGQDGRCQKLVTYYGKQPVFEDIHEEKTEIIENPVFTLRAPKASEMLEVCRGIYNEYGLTYINDLVYYPERFFAAIEADVFHSTIAVDQYGNFAGHHGAFEWDIVPGIFESGLAVVSNRYRNSGLFNKFMEKTSKYIIEDRHAKFYVGGCTTTHPYSMKARLKLGSSPCAYRFNLAPPDIVQTAFRGKNSFSHEAFAGIPYDFTERTVYYPDEVVTAVSKIYDSMKLPRNIITEGDPSATDDSTESVATFNKRLRTGEINIKTFGNDYKQKLHDSIIDIKSQGAEAISLYLSAESPVLQDAYKTAKEDGFFFTGIFPNTKQGDVLMMENILSNTVNYSEIVSIEPFTELLEFIRSLDPDQQKR